MVPELNNEEWFKWVLPLEIDRISMLSIVGCLELALRHPQLPASVSDYARAIGRTFALRLVSDGLVLPDREKKCWEETFGIELKPDQVYRRAWFPRSFS